MTQSMDYSGGTVTYRELLEDGCNVVFDRLIADLERLGYLLVTVATCDVVEYLHFTARKRRVGVLVLAVFLFHRQFAERLENATGELWLREDIVIDQIFT